MKYFLIALVVYLLCWFIHDICYYIKRKKCSHVLGYSYRGFAKSNDNSRALRCDYQDKKFIRFNYCSKCGCSLNHEKIYKKINKR